MSYPLSPLIPRRYCSAPPCGGTIGPLPEHFVVSEVAAYLPSGEGEHLYLWIQKIGLNTTDVVKRLARHADCRERDIGYAGMKDKNAITTQWFSLLAKDQDAQNWALGEGCEVLRVSHHKNKLRTGHLIGNRFEITLHGVAHNAAQAAERIAAELRQRGFPNYFGPQRFGYGGRNLEKARAWLAQQQAQSSSPVERGRSRRARDHFDSKLLSSVVQSEVFNRYLDARLQTREKLLRGEVVRLSGTGTHFIVEDLVREQERYDRADFVLTGPMVGPKGVQSLHDALSLEHKVLDELGLDENQRAELAKHAPGTRRDLFVMPEELQLDTPVVGELRISFTLPAGAYATGLIREFTDAPWDAPRSGPS